MKTSVPGKERVRVLQVITGLGAGGAERLVLDLVKHYDKNTIDMRLVSIVDDLSGLDVYDQRDINTEVFDFKRNPVHAFWELRRAIVRFRPHVVHAHMFHSMVAAALAIQGLSLRPAICFTSHKHRFRALRSMVTRALKGARTADIIFHPHQHPSLNAPRAVVIPNGVSVRQAPPARRAWSEMRPVRLLAVGRLTEEKDPVGLVRSFAAAQLTNATLRFVGGGPLESAARAAAAELGVQKSVQFLGVRSDVRELMNDSDIFVMHSRIEGMPLALLEAGAEAMPVIATPVGSIPSLLTGGLGWTATPETFSGTLRQVVSSPQKALAAGLALYAHIHEKHSIESTLGAHERLYASLAAAMTQTAAFRL